jgi:hypothetical protein
MLNIAEILIATQEYTPIKKATVTYQMQATLFMFHSMNVIILPFDGRIQIRVLHFITEYIIFADSLIVKTTKVSLGDGYKLKLVIYCALK